jgi:hypothetical protein
MKHKYAHTEQMPTETPTDRERGLEYNHPAFGQITASRMSGRSVLYGSDFEHHHTVRVTLHSSSLIRQLNSDWHHTRQPIAEFEMSEAQWAHFVSSMSDGSGTPVTLRYLREDGHMPTIPLRQERPSSRWNWTLPWPEPRSVSVRQWTKSRGNLASPSRRSSVGRSWKASNCWSGDISDSLPFMQKQMGEAMENMVEKAKIEVEAWAESVVMKVDLQAIAGGATSMPIALNSGNPRNDHVCGVPNRVACDVYLTVVLLVQAPQLRQPSYEMHVRR